MITLKNIYFAFKKKNDVLKNISLEIKEGERVAIVGHNGAGKSTLVDVILGVKKVRLGSVSYKNNIDIKKISGVQFQSKEFPTGMKMKQLLEFYLDIHKMKLKDEKVQEMLKRFKLKGKINYELKKLSGGQQQKFNIMIALMNNPSLLIVDEIISALDITSQRKILDLIKKILVEDKSISLITVSHSPIELNLLVDRVIVLHKGEIQHDLKIEEIKDNYKSLDLFLGGLHE